MNTPSNDSFIIELIGFNDGCPYEVYSTEDENRAWEPLDIAVKESPSVAHRLVKVVSYVEPLNNSP